MDTYYRVKEQRYLVSFTVKDKLMRKTTKVHVNHFRLADIDNWEIPKENKKKQNKGSPLRKSVYVAPLSYDDNIPLARLAKHLRKEPKNSFPEKNL